MIGEFPLRDARGVLFTDDGRYLMQLRDDLAHLRVPGHWGCFGGRLDADEAPADGLRRELAEELAFRPAAVTWFTEHAYVLPQLDVAPTHVTFFEVPIAEADVAAMVLAEGQAMRLFAISELLRQPRIVPWDVYGVLVHARRETVFRKPTTG